MAFEHLQFKNEVSKKNASSFEYQGTKVRKKSGRVQRKASLFLFCEGRPGFIDLF